MGFRPIGQTRIPKTCHCSCSCGTVTRWPCDEACSCCEGNDGACCKKCGGDDCDLNPDNMATSDGKQPYFNANSRNKHLNASGFLGTGVSGFKVIWWSLGALLLLGVVGKGIKVYKQAKS